MLAAAERRILEAVCAAVVPRALDDVAPRPDELVTFVTRFLAAQPPLSLAGFRAALWVLELTTIVARGRRLSRLPRGDAQSVLGAWWASRLGPARLVIRVVGGFALLALYAAPSVRQRLELPC
jgi:hypothetical protein